ncbi:MAG: hypothetical protein MUD12_13765 [Spirochaetes bacterium]|jgi:ATP-dependent protease Clp ATPase subunit|nr:hypothetical protein [Spirochaetota bacterium]
MAVKSKSRTAKKPARSAVVSTPSSDLKSKKRKKKTNLLRLYMEMNKLSSDAVDREVIKRFKVIIDTCEEDITKTNLMSILREPKGVDVSSFDEIFQPYIKHYVFLYKRYKRSN